MDTPLHYFFSRRTNPRTFDVLTRGPLGPYLTAYAQRLHDDGYATQSGELQLRMLGHFNQWLERQRTDAAAVTSLTVERYIRSRRRGQLQPHLSRRARGVPWTHRRLGRGPVGARRLLVRAAAPDHRPPFPGPRPALAGVSIVAHVGQPRQERDHGAPSSRAETAEHLVDDPLHVRSSERAVAREPAVEVAPPHEDLPAR